MKEGNDDVARIIKMPLYRKELDLITQTFLFHT